MTPPDPKDPPDPPDPNTPLPPVTAGPMDVPLAGSRKTPVPPPDDDTSGYPPERPAGPAASRPVSRAVSRPVRDDDTSGYPAERPPPGWVYGMSESGPATGVPRPVSGAESGGRTATESKREMVVRDLAATYDEIDELRDAAGGEPPYDGKRRKKRRKRDAEDADGDDEPRPRRRRTGLVVALTMFVGLGAGAAVVVGYINSRRYAIACESEQVIAQRGRAFPPWGMRPLGGDLWKPIKIPANAECRSRETEDDYELGGWYLEVLVDRASTLLTAREVTKADEAAGMLEQALLHARAPERRDQRKEIERLLGDVGYWRASAKLRDAANAVTDAAKQFDTAAAQRPRHVSDASAWAQYARKIAEELRAGPASAGGAQPAAPSPPLPPERPAPPAGVALPVEPPGSAAPAPTSVNPPDAGVPTGGVLL